MFGLSQDILETIVFCMIGAAVLGVILVLYWRFIIAGAAAVFCIVVLANHKVPDAPSVASVVKEVTTITEEAEDRVAFIEDCLAMTDYSKNQCVKIWEGREDEEEHASTVMPVVAKPAEGELQLLDVDNVDYKQKRSDALKKPNAVIGQVTYR